MNEHTHNHALEEKIPSPWGRVAGVLFALSGLAMIPNGALSSIKFWIIDIPFFLTAFFLIKSNRGKGLLIATGLLATLPTSSYFYYIIDDLRYGFYDSFFEAFSSYIYSPIYLGFIFLFLFCLKMLLFNDTEKPGGILAKLWFIPALFPLYVFIREFAYCGGLEYFRSRRFDFNEFLYLQIAPLILFLAMLAAGNWLVKPEIIISTSTGGTGMEHRIKCQTCGQIFCYTDADINENDWNKAMRSMSGLATFLSALDGSKYDMYEQNKVGRSFDNKIKDYSHCPNCNSTNLIELTENDELQSTSINGQTLAIQNSVAHNFSNADEIKRFKELLDSGVITSEEFEAKKQELLNK